jgi:general secretion pathway protein G
MNKDSLNQKESGFTLLELMVVVLILGILVTLVVPKVIDRPDEAKIVKVKSDLRALENALGMYKLDNHKYPSTDDGLEALVKKPESATKWPDGGYIARLPKDPWGTDYQFISPGEHGSIDIYSLGADKQAGGEGMDSDIGNWNLE